jgi:FG-GAP-like repeat/Putative zinc-finger
MTDHDRFRELAAGAADDILSPEEARVFALHVRTCPACRAEVHAFARDRDVLAAIAPTSVSARLTTIVAESGRRRTSLRWPLLATAVLVGTLGAAYVLTGGAPRTAVAPKATATPSSAAPTATPSSAPPTAVPSLDSTIVRTGDVRTLDLGGRAASLAIDDIDDDGDEDLAMGTDGSPDQVVLYLGDGAGDFGGRVVTDLDGVAAIEVIDLDGDGLADILGTARETNEVVILYGLGRGGFEDPVRPSVGRSPRELQTIDVDGDGRLDIVTANAGSDDLSVLRATGPRSFARAASVPADDAPTVLAAGDFDLDGHADLVAGSVVHPGITVQWGVGDGTFSSHRPIPGDVAIADIAAGDLDADGDLDLVATPAGVGPVAVLLARPTGPFWTELSLAPPAPETDRPGDIEIADLTGDGVADLVAADRAHDTLLVWVGDGHGGFLDAQAIPLSGPPKSVEVGDVDGDGQMDLVVTDAEDPKVRILLGR